MSLQFRRLRRVRGSFFRKILGDLQALRDHHYLENFAIHLLGYTRGEKDTVVRGVPVRELGEE